MRDRTGRRGQSVRAGKRSRRSPRLEWLEARELLSVSPHEDVSSPAIAQRERLPFYVPPRTQLTSSASASFTAPGANDPLEVAFDYLRGNAAQLGIESNAIDTALVTDNYTDAHNGVTHIYLQQTHAGRRIANATISINVASNGRVLNAGSTFIGGLNAGVITDALALDARDAIAAAGKALGLHGEISLLPDSATDAPSVDQAYLAPGYSRDVIAPRLQYVPSAGGELALSWNLRLRTPDSLHWYNASIDAGTGALNLAVDWVSDAAYDVLAAPSESPQESGRVVIQDPHDPVASPFGWHDTNGVAGAEFTDTRGNNVFAQEDRDNTDDGGHRPNGGASLTFDFPFNTSQDPVTYEDASITNLFYWGNLLHDVHYQYGFDEPSGNFQFNNYGRGGAGGDPVMADAQDGSGTNNANMFTPPDGESPRMQQYIFDLTTPRRDSSLANEIITHEFGHGVSNRLTGGPANADALNAWQSAGMGEGWSDFWALMFTQDPTDTKLAAYPQGTYVLGQAANGPGIREEPYSFDFAINHHTLGDYNLSSWLHDAGELWCSALWDMNWLLIDKYGYEPNLATGYTGAGGAGNLLAMQLVADGLKLQPANPTFTEARDAIVLADQVLTGGANAREIWTAFARRGFGLSADVDDGNGADSQFVVEAFDTPIFDLHVTASTPTAGAIVATPPTQFALTFSQQVLAGSVNANDLLVNGIPASTVQIVDAQNLLFTYAASPVTTQGTQTMSMAAGALQRVLDGDGSVEFSLGFRYDSLRMAVTATAPANGATVTLPLATIDVDLNEAVLPASVDVADLQITDGSVSSVELLDADTVRFHVSGLNVEGALGYQLAAGAFQDAFGNPSLEFSGQFQLDVGVAPFAGAFTPVGPMGSLGYAAGGAGIIGLAGDVDVFTLQAVAGRLLTIDASSSPGWQPRIVVRNPQGTAIATLGGGASGALIVPELPLAAGGLYSLEFSAPPSAVGAYQFSLRLNVSREDESNGGGANDTRGTAQSLTDAFVSPDGAAERAVLAGRIAGAGNAPVEIEPNGTTTSATALDANFITPRPNFFQMEISGAQGTSSDVDWFNFGTLHAGDFLTISVAAESSRRGTLEDPILKLYQRNGGIPLELARDDDTGPVYDPLIYRFQILETDEYLIEVDDYFSSDLGTYQIGVMLETSGIAPATGGAIVAESESNGNPAQADDISASWRPVVRQSTTRAEISRSIDTDYYRFNAQPGDLLTVDAQGDASLPPSLLLTGARGGAVAEDDGDMFSNRSGVYALRVTVGGNYYLRVQSPGGSTGYTLNVYLSSTNPPVSAVGAPDYYSVALAAGESLSLTLDGQDGYSMNLAIEDGGGNVLAEGAADIGFGQAIEEFVAPSAGIYYLAARGSVQQDYTLGVARGAAFDFEPNNSAATAQALPASGAVLGEIAGLDVDVFRLPMQIGQRTRFDVAAALAGLGTISNTLEPLLELFDANGGLMDQAFDGSLDFNTQLAGDYFLHVRAVTGAGEYALRTTELGTALDGDTNGDGRVDLDDLNNVRNGFGGLGLGDTAPFDGDVDLDDLNAVRNNFGAMLPSPARTSFVARTAVAAEHREIALIRPGRLLGRDAADALFHLLGDDVRHARKPNRGRIA